MFIGCFYLFINEALAWSLRLIIILLSPISFNVASFDEVFMLHGLHWCDSRLWIFAKHSAHKIFDFRQESLECCIIHVWLLILDKFECCFSIWALEW